MRNYEKIGKYAVWFIIIIFISVVVYQNQPKEDSLPVEIKPSSQCDHNNPAPWLNK